MSSTTAADLGGPLGEQPFDVLVVCTANMCRSPMAEHLLRQALQQRFGARAGWDWEVRSAGTHVMTGTNMHELAREVLMERGIPVEGVPAHQATTPVLERADLILTASRPQRAWIVERLPTSVRRVYTMRQFARLCVAGRGASDAAGQSLTDGTALMTAATLGRPQMQPVSDELDTIFDPIGQDLQAFRDCADVIERCIDDILGPSTT